MNPEKIEIESRIDSKGEMIYYRARHYDAINRHYMRDVPFYRRLAGREKPLQILELACGTGRISLPLGDDGHKVVGLDISMSMLELAAEKAVKRKLNNIRLIHADCRNFVIQQQFDLIIMGFNSLAHLYKNQDIINCFSSVRRHLAADGRFVLSVFNPNIHLLCRNPLDRFLVDHYPDPEGEEFEGGSSSYIQLTESNFYDSASQINHIKWFFNRSDGESWMEKLDMRLVFPQELDLLIRHCGFNLEKKYGDFDFSPFNSSSPNQIVILTG